MKVDYIVSIFMMKVFLAMRAEHNALTGGLPNSFQKFGRDSRIITKGKNHLIYQAGLKGQVQ